MMNLTDGWLARAIAAHEAGCTKSADAKNEIIRAQFLHMWKDK
jgi:hypothetical protein